MPAASHPLLAGLVDDAALFPPGNAPMAEGLAAHARHRAAPYAAAVGPFLCAASRVPELLDVLPGDQRIALSLVVDATGAVAHGALRAVAADDRVDLVGVEAPLRLLGDDAVAVGANLGSLPGVTGYLEVPADEVAAGLDLVGRSGWDAVKYRTGGVSKDAFPDEARLAGLVGECVARGLPVKLTAGLHHAVRNTSPEGFEQHGVLNVLVAVRAARSGADTGRTESLLAERDAGALAAEVRRWTEADAAAVRSTFRSFGCCGVTDPLDDLADLGVLEDHP